MHSTTSSPPTCRYTRRLLGSNRYQYGKSIWVGMGAPDLMATRKGRLNNPLTVMHEGVFSQTQ